MLTIGVAGFLLGRSGSGTVAPSERAALSRKPSVVATGALAKAPADHVADEPKVTVTVAADADLYDGESARATGPDRAADPPRPDEVPSRDDAVSPAETVPEADPARSDDAAPAVAIEPSASPPRAQATDSGPEAACDRPPPPPLPAPGSPVAPDFWQAFRTPLPLAPVCDPPGRKRVGLQAGHWRVEEAPRELSRLEHGATGGGRAEWEVNVELARGTAELLRGAGVDVDILPATVPISYRAHAFLSIHADGDPTGSVRGYKLARSTISATPDADDRLVRTLYDLYGEATGLPRDDAHVSRRMTGYYAVNSRRYCHAIAPGVPSAILETGFLTNAADRQLLLGRPDTAARGIARGLLRYLNLPE